MCRRPLEGLDAKAACALDACVADDPAMLMFTSGTTGRPKGAILSHGNALASAQGVHVAWRWTPEDRLVLTLPLFHMHGLGVGVHGTLLTGASMAIAPFSVDGVLDLAAEERATLFFGVPTMYVRLAASDRVGELAALRLCVSGSAALAADVWRALAERGGQRVIERYGMTETFMNTSNTFDADRRPGSVGIAPPGVEVRLGDNDEICVRGPNVMRTYWERPDATRMLPRRLVPHRRHRRVRRRRLPQHRGEVEGPHHHRRVERLPAGDRGAAGRAPRCRRGGGRR